MSIVTIEHDCLSDKGGRKARGKRHKAIRPEKALTAAAICPRSTNKVKGAGRCARAARYAKPIQCKRSCRSVATLSVPVSLLRLFLIMNFLWQSSVYLCCISELCKEVFMYISRLIWWCYCEVTRGDCYSVFVINCKMMMDQAHFGEYLLRQQMLHAASLSGLRKLNFSFLLFYWVFDVDWWEYWSDQLIDFITLRYNVYVSLWLLIYFIRLKPSSSI